MKDKKLFSEKFRKYFLLHLKCLRGEIFSTLFMGWFAGWIWGGLDRDKVIILAIIIGGWSMRAFARTCSGMLYQQEAYLYQSFPVSAFETVFTKVTAGALVLVAGLLPVSFQIYGLGGAVFTPAIIAGSLLVGGIILAAIGFGNSMRDSRAKKPSMFASSVAAILMLAAQAGLIVVFAKYVPMETGLKILILTGVFLIEAAAFLWHNTRSLKYNYQV